MGYGELRNRLDTFDQIIDKMNLSIGDDTLLKDQLNLIRKFLLDRTELSEAELNKKYNSQFKKFYDALIVIERFTDSVASLEDQPPEGLRKCIKLILAGKLTNDFIPQQAKDYFFEIEMAALFRKSGFHVKLSEPDMVVSGCGLTAPYGIACKYPSSEKQIHVHLSKGYRQIAKQNLKGLVAIGLDQIVFKGMNNYIDFRKIEMQPLDLMQQKANEEMQKLVIERRNDYPSEPPIDGAIITLALPGIYGKPASLITVRAVIMQCDSRNPMIADIERMTNELNKVAREVMSKFDIEQKTKWGQAEN